MFARTPRLLLRPPFPDDAATLAATIGDERIVRNLATAPWPYRFEDARAFVDIVDNADPLLPTWLMLLRGSDAPRIVGGVGIARRETGELELGYWVARPYWGLGFATEAARQLRATARALKLPPLTAGHFVDNPASGAVLRKLGFRPTGQIAPRYSLARGGDAPCVVFAEDVDAPVDAPPGDMRRSTLDREDWRLIAA